jgi:hypothetical protein
MGDLEREHGEYFQAISGYEKSRALYDKTDDLKGQHIIMGELYRAYKLAGVKEKAEEWKLKAEAAIEHMSEFAADYVARCIETLDT